MTESCLQMSHDLNNDPIFLSILEDIKADRLGNFLYNGSESPSRELPLAMP